MWTEADCVRGSSKSRLQSWETKSNLSGIHCITILSNTQATLQETWLSLRWEALPSIPAQLLVSTVQVITAAWFSLSALLTLLPHLFINSPEPQVWAATGKLLSLFYSKSTGEKYFCKCRLPCEVVWERHVWLALQMGWKIPHHHFKTLTLFLSQKDRKCVLFPSCVGALPLFKGKNCNI